MNQLLARVRNLDPDRRALLTLRLTHLLRGSRRIPRHVGNRYPAPLSVAQEGLWYLEQLDPGNPRLSLTAHLRLNGPLNAAALRQAIRNLVRRHEALRHRFVDTEAGPVQELQTDSPIRAAWTDLTGPGSVSTEPLAELVIHAEARRPVDLEYPPLLRVRVVRHGHQEHRLILTVHHIVSDAWSFLVLVRDWVYLYGCCVAGRPAVGREPKIGFADFAHWQRIRGRENGLEVPRRYWRRKLAGLEPFELATDFPRRQKPESRAGQASQVVRRPEPELVGQLQELGRAHGATAFMTFLAVFQWFLHRYTGRDDVVVGTPLAGRRWKETEALVGYFLHVVPLRSRVEGTLEFRELLRQARHTVLEAQEHQDLPFPLLTAEASSYRQGRGTPLIHVLFLWVDTLLPTKETVGGLTVDPFEWADETVMQDLTVQIENRSQGPVVRWVYDRQLWRRETVEAMAEELTRMLQKAVRALERTGETARARSSAQSHLLHVELPATQRLFPGPDTLHGLFAEQAHRHPDRIAVIASGRHVSYGELQRRADRCARRLRARGAGPETVVGLLLERSPELVEALLGVWKSGGAYLPLDPEYPPAYVGHLIREAGAQVVVTHRSLASRLPESAPPALYLDGDGPEVTGALPEVGAHGLAYVIFTSGSTGSPKGVMIPHRGIRNRLLWMGDHLPLTAADRVLHKAPFTFDVSLWELFWPLLHGASTVIARRGGHREPGYLLEIIRREEVTAAQFVPSLLRSFVEETVIAAGDGPCPSLRRVVASGEALPLDLAEEFRDYIPATLYNFYGPTEASVGVSHYRLGSAERHDPVCLGWPMSNLTLHVLDAHLEPLSPGTDGELCIGGAALARGYLGQPARTAERFVPSPWGTGQRLYRTGDVARRLPDGRLVYRGRGDEQVKVRGFRIELQEVETACRAHPAVVDAAADARVNAVGDRRLVAWVVLDADTETWELSRFLAQRLPPWMVPSRIARIDSLPTTKSGKRDRRALPDPEIQELRVHYEAPRNRLERMVSRIWQDVLGLERVGVRDHFFELGGHSLLLARVRRRLSDEMNRSLSMVELLEHPTVGSLARHLAAPAAGNTPEIEAGRSQRRQAALARRRRRIASVEDIP